jgi:hypothetical protein
MFDSYSNLKDAVRDLDQRIVARVRELGAAHSFRSAPVLAKAASIVR